MDELYEMLKKKLYDMREIGNPSISFTFDEVSKLYQLVCMMKRIKEITDWCDKGYS
jgi:hypothetical protein